jgi:hypothetical protein
MFEHVLVHLVSGVAWGTGAGLALGLTRGGAAELRPVAKALLKGAVVLVDRVQEVTAEARETVEDLYAEVRAEQQAQVAADTVDRKPRAGARAPRGRRPG